MNNQFPARTLSILFGCGALCFTQILNIDAAHVGHEVSDEVDSNHGRDSEGGEPEYLVARPEGPRRLSRHALIPSGAIRRSQIHALRQMNAIEQVGTQSNNQAPDPTEAPTPAPTPNPTPQPTSAPTPNVDLEAQVALAKASADSAKVAAEHASADAATTKEYIDELLLLKQAEEEDDDYYYYVAPIIITPCPTPCPTPCQQDCDCDCDEEEPETPCPTPCPTPAPTPVPQVEHHHYHHVEHTHHHEHHWDCEEPKPCGSALVERADQGAGHRRHRGGRRLRRRSNKDRDGRALLDGEESLLDRSEDASYDYHEEAQASNGPPPGTVAAPLPPGPSCSGLVDESGKADMRKDEAPRVAETPTVPAGNGPAIADVFDRRDAPVVDGLVQTERK